MKKTTITTIAAAVAIAGSATVAAAQPPAQGSPAARFAYLSKQTSNRCTLTGAAVMHMQSSARLQGSCCFPMDRAAYDNQIGRLARYERLAVVPKDPYDIPVSLAQRLLGYQSLRLTRTQQRIYNAAVPLSTTRGPCCCRCWRAEAFAGQAKFLIARESFSARQIGALWSAEEGCGGPED
jgi:hypothetical protein